MTRFLTYTLYISIAAMMGCKSSEPLGEKALIDTFTKNADELNTQFKAYHVNEDSTRFYIKINTNNLQYNKNVDGEMKASVLIKISPIALGEVPKEITSKAIRIEDFDESSENKILLGSTTIALPIKHNYEVNATITDENKKVTYTTNFYCAKADKKQRQFFVASDSDVLNPVFGDRIEAGKEYLIENGTNADGQVLVRYYDRKFPRPLPPFVPHEPPPFEYQADSIFVLRLDQNNQGKFTSAERGFYHFQNDTSSTKGFTLFVSSQEFPHVKTIENMIDPFRYLVSNKDYEQVMQAENQRQELESFWIEWAGSKDRARKAIKLYYSRVEEANRLFSSHVEGWKSDRGIIYAVYGKPNKVYNNQNVETWIYGDEQNPLSITFNFAQVINPFTQNDYRLIRDEIYKPSWYHSLNACRYGKN